MAKGYLALVLHAHLPYVRHPEWDHFMEEGWLFEAINETYIPLLSIFEKLVHDGVHFRITMSLTPPLIAMLNDELLRDRYQRHLENLIELGNREVHRTRGDGAFEALAQFYRQRFQQIHHYYTAVAHRDLVGRFKALQDQGVLEIITCGATHGFLPLMLNEKAQRAQIQIAALQYKKTFGRTPRGIWLPECGYLPGVEKHLKEAGIRFFFVDTHAVLYASPRPRYGVFAPVYCRNKVAAFGRDIESSKQVWSAEEGYPGDAVYRDFYRDIGFDLDFQYVKPFIHPDGIRLHTGYKYHRITGRTVHKEPYVRSWAIDKAAEHAGNFMFNREKQVEYLSDFLGRKPIVVAPYDAELYGHWWFEGPEFLDFLFRKIHYDQQALKTITPYEYLEMYPVNQVCQPVMSSWGYKGFAEVWLEGSNDWIYRHLLMASDRMVELAQRFPNPNPLTRRALNQAARELLLAQSSDWAFIMKSGTTVPYAAKRTADHVWRFNRLYEGLNGAGIDGEWLGQIEAADAIFPEIDYRLFR